MKKGRSNERLSEVTCYISCGREAVHYVKELSEFLHGIGVLVFESVEFSKGDRWVEKFRTEIAHADLIIIIGTPHAFRSKLVKSELLFIQSLKKNRIWPIMFRGVGSLNEVPDFLMSSKFYREEGEALKEGPSPLMLKALSSYFREIQISKSHGKVSDQRGSTPNRARLQSANKRPLNEGKLILVGRGEVGKTSIVKRLCKDDFRGDESKTQGINITTWPLICQSETFRLNVWDFGGQEIMHATHQFFLTERSLYLLVLNGREGGEDLDAEYWLKHIESFGADSPVIVVQNKISQHPFDLNYRGLQARYPQIRGFVKTDCVDSTGISQLRMHIQRVATEMPEIRMQFPGDWFVVKEKLESTKDDFMGYEGFRQLCSGEGISDESDQDAFCWILHCLGIALNYRDDSRLRETSVLKPEWVTNGIYKILNAKTLAIHQGELQLGDLGKLLPTGRYPVNKHLFILELMRKFSLCFAFPDERDRYLVPELLGKEEPEEASHFVAGDCLNFEYHYAILPEGLIPRFIVRSHILSRGQARWRSGVILAHEECKALVKADVAERRVIVRVIGGNAGARRRILAIIRYDLDRINSEFKDRFDAKPKVPLRDFPAFSVDYKKLVAFEKEGVPEFPEFIGDEVVTVNVNELLNGVDLKTQRQESVEDIVQAKSIFFSYSHKDEGLRDELETHLKLMQRQGVISTWHDRKILPGSEWDREIDSHLEMAKIILLLISADFIASEYCWEMEVTRAIERHESGEAAVIPVMLRSCDWQNAPFKNLQGLPKEMIPVTTWQDRDAAWTDVVMGIREIAENFDQGQFTKITK